MLNKANQSQKEAITTIQGPLLILAGAGTGKTFTLTSRVANLILSNAANPENILSVTFTNKAAREMKNRIEQQAPDAKNMWIGTFHGISARILRLYAEAVDLNPNFIIIDDSDRKRFIKQIIEQLNIDEKRFSVNAIAFIISSLKDNKVKFNDCDKILSFKYQKLDLVELYYTYHTKLRAMNAVDFDDLVFECINLFEAHPAILNDLQERFRYILVDEYQDTNKLQYLWLKILSSKYYNICCVGDEDQSIYGWRGAEIKYILNFPQDFPGAKIIRLEDNYRSTDAILKVAMNVIKNNQERYGKNLHSNVNAVNKKPKVVINDDDRKEAFDIAKRSKTMSEMYQYDNMAILVRASYQMRIIEEALIKSHVNYKVIDGIRFYDRKEIKDLISYIRFAYLDNDRLSFERIINTPKRSIGEKTIEEIFTFANEAQITVVQAINAIVSNVIESSSGFFHKIPILSSKAMLSLADFVTKLKKWKDIINQSYSLVEIAEIIYSESGYGAMLREEVEKDPEVHSRIENIREFISSLKQFQDVGEFLEHISLLSSSDDSQQEDAISIMTMHGAKGLEFDVVFLPGWDEEMFPSRKSIEENGNKGLEEERRLAYVALTRAKKELIIYSSKQRSIFGRINQMMPSRFIVEMGNDVETINQANKGYINSSSFSAQTIKRNVDSEVTKFYNSPKDVFPKVGESVLHDKFGTGLIKSEIGQFFEIQFYDGITRVIKKDFVKKTIK
jgi:DNA helicase-2/ATP-dependent DNA helicase PcrA